MPSTIEWSRNITHRRSCWARDKTHTHSDLPDLFEREQKWNEESWGSQQFWLLTYAQRMRCARANYFAESKEVQRFHRKIVFSNCWLAWHCEFLRAQNLCFAAPFPLPISMYVVVKDSPCVFRFHTSLEYARLRHRHADEISVWRWLRYGTNLGVCGGGKSRMHTGEEWSQIHQRSRSLYKTWQAFSFIPIRFHKNVRDFSTLWHALLRWVVAFSVSCPLFGHVLTLCIFLPMFRLQTFKGLAETSNFEYGPDWLAHDRTAERKMNSWV